jgi:hypothetical protein
MKLCRSFVPCTACRCKILVSRVVLTMGPCTKRSIWFETLAFALFFILVFISLMSHVIHVMLCCASARHCAAACTNQSRLLQAGRLFSLAFADFPMGLKTEHEDMLLTLKDLKQLCLDCYDMLSLAGSFVVVVSWQQVRTAHTRNSPLFTTTSHTTSHTPQVSHVVAACTSAKFKQVVPFSWKAPSGQGHRHLGSTLTSDFVCGVFACKATSGAFLLNAGNSKAGKKPVGSLPPFGFNGCSNVFGVTKETEWSLQQGEKAEYVDGQRGWIGQGNAAEEANSNQVCGNQKPISFYTSWITSLLSTPTLEADGTGWVDNEEPSLILDFFTGCGSFSKS